MNDDEHSLFMALELVIVTWMCGKNVSIHFSDYTRSV